MRRIDVHPPSGARVRGVTRDAIGDAALQAELRRLFDERGLLVFEEMQARMHPYFHACRPHDMVLWDNRRFLHSCTGHDPAQARHMHRTTIHGDYGPGRFEGEAAGKELAEAMM